MFKETLPAILLCLLSMLTSSAHAIDRDGRWWGQMNQGEKLSYIAGFFDGTAYSVMVLTSTSLNAMADPKTGKFNSTRAEAVKAASLGAIQTVQE